MALSGNLGQGQRTFDQLVVLGDSLSDMGNAGRFSNGPVWIEQLPQSLKLPLRASERGGQNFAVGGARIEVAAEPARTGQSGLKAAATLGPHALHRLGRGK
jgi:cholinesterase